MFTKFLLGSLKIDDSVKKVLGRVPLDLVSRHAVCEHGVVTPRRYKQNMLSLQEAGEIQSEYLIDPTQPKQGTVIVTTSSGWGETIVSLKKQPRAPRKKKDSDDFPI